jgi:cytochrome c peroxidase
MELGKWVMTLLLLGLSTLASSCEWDKPYAPTAFEFEVPSGFPQPVLEADNPFTREKVELGRMLFYDPILSLDSSISCATCHFQALAFSDTVPLSRGFDGRLGNRNAPPLFNLAWHPYFNKDGGTPTIELQMFVPIQDENEMNHNLVPAAERLARNPFYRQYFSRAFDREPDAYGITRAIGLFERMLVSADSPFDRYYYHGQTAAMSPAAQRGWDIFRSDSTQCATCHSLPNFTNYAFENNGYFASYPDPGRARVTLSPSDIGKFKTPSLRNIALTGPYMHDGSVATLSEIIDQYQAGGSGYVNQSPILKPFSLTPDQKADLLAFLDALTDPSFIENPAFGKPTISF